MKYIKHLACILFLLPSFFINNATAVPEADEVIVCESNPNRVTLRWNRLYNISNYKMFYQCPSAYQPQTGITPCTYVHIPIAEWNSLAVTWCRVIIHEDDLPDPVLPDGQLPTAPNPIRLKHMKTGKCVYGLKNQNNWKAYNWICWSDPGMAFKKVSINSNKFRLQHIQSGLCLLTQGTNGSHVELKDCSLNSGAMIFTKEPTSNGKFRLKSSNNKCLYGNPNDGDSVNAWDCWNDPNMEFIFE